jgi:2-iminobutanoate/2-iminopropanoate deaminase
MEDYSVFNEHYVAAFGNHRPSRSCVAVAELPANFVVEIEAWAYKPAGR